MNYINNLRTSNKKLIMELQNLDLKTEAGIKRREEIAAEIRGNNQDMQAFASALGSRSEQSRLFNIKRQQG